MDILGEWAWFCICTIMLVHNKSQSMVPVYYQYSWSVLKCKISYWPSFFKCRTKASALVDFRKPVLDCLRGRMWPDPTWRVAWPRRYIVSGCGWFEVLQPGWSGTEEYSTMGKLVGREGIRLQVLQVCHDWEHAPVLSVELGSYPSSVTHQLLGFGQNDLLWSQFFVYEKDK